MLTGSCDVFVSESGVRFEYGPRHMKTDRKPTEQDIVEFVRHVRWRERVRGERGLTVKFMGVALA